MASKEVTPLADVQVIDATTGEIKLVKGWAAAVPQADEDAFLQQIVEGYLSAQSLDDLLKIPEGTEGLKDFVGKVVTFHDARWSPSAFKKGPGCFYILDISTPDRTEHLLVTTGATNVMAIIAKAHMAGWLPFSARVVEVASGSNPENKIQYLVNVEAF
jgi:hypothetical protein